MSGYSVDDLTAFLNFAAAKGLLNKTTASAKRTAVERVFEGADPTERADVRDIDLTSLMHRFMNLSGSGFKPDSLATYQSRVRSAIEEFVAWKSNPMSFRPSRRGSTKKPRSTVKTELPVPTGSAEPKAQPAPQFSSTTSLPIPIRNDLTVIVQGLPFDLSKAEATKIANVVLAMATEVST